MRRSYGVVKPAEKETFKEQHSMIIEDTIFLWVLLLSIVVGIVLTIFVIRLLCKDSSIALKSSLKMIGMSLILLTTISTISYVILKLLVSLFLSLATTTIHEIDNTDGKFLITSKCYFCKSRLPDGSNPEVLKTKGIYYYNNTNQDIACFNINYYNEPFTNELEMARSTLRIKEEEPSKDFFAIRELADKNTVIGDVITPHSYYASEQIAKFAFEPSPPIITVIRSKKEKHDSEKVIIMDVPDSILKHHGVKFVAR